MVPNMRARDDAIQWEFLRRQDNEENYVRQRFFFTYWCFVLLYVLVEPLGSVKLGVRHELS